MLYSKCTCVWCAAPQRQDPFRLVPSPRFQALLYYRLTFLARTSCPVKLITKLGFDLNYEWIFTCIWPRVRYCLSFLMMCLQLVFILDLISQCMSANTSIIMILLSGRKEIKPQEVTSKLWIWCQCNRGPGQDWSYEWGIGTQQV